MANTNTNSYTLIYAVIMTLVVAILLAGVATSLRPIQAVSEALDKKNSILQAVLPDVTKDQAEQLYKERITEIVVAENGSEVSGKSAFDIELKKEYRKAGADRSMPVYMYKDGQEMTYIMPLHGAGLWDEIWGYVAIDKDFKTIKGVSFDHKGETPGLGAEIKDASWFKSQFIGKKLTDASGKYQLKVLKGKGNKLTEGTVDGISGATITGDGVGDMIEKGYGSYSAYFKSKGRSNP